MDDFKLIAPAMLLYYCKLWGLGLYGAVRRLWSDVLKELRSA